MYLPCFDDVKKLTEELVKIPSIVKTSGEADCARRIHQFYRSLPYFQRNPEYLWLQRTEDDEIERYNVLAMVKGTKGGSRRTIILMGHLDTVGVDDFGNIKEYAFEPERLPQHLRQMDLGEDVQKDLDSGEYMFGRGALDMKSGIAGHMWLMRYFSEHPEELDGNIIAIAECDEEDNSHGIISALKALKQWKAEHDLELLPPSTRIILHLSRSGSQPLCLLRHHWQLLPTFYVVGKETHVGRPSEG